MAALNQPTAGGVVVFAGSNGAPLWRFAGASTGNVRAVAVLSGGGYVVTYDNGDVELWH